MHLRTLLSRRSLLLVVLVMASSLLEITTSSLASSVAATMLATSSVSLVMRLLSVLLLRRNLTAFDFVSNHTDDSLKICSVFFFILLLEVLLALPEINLQWLSWTELIHHLIELDASLSLLDIFVTNKTNLVVRVSLSRLCGFSLIL